MGRTPKLTGHVVTHGHERDTDSSEPAGTAPSEPGFEGMVAGIFSERAAVTRAIDELIEAHFDPDQDLRVLVTHGKVRKEAPVAFRSGAQFGSALGGAICLVLGAIAAVLMALGRIPGPASVANMVPWVAGVEGAIAGGASGYLLGMVAGLGFWSYHVAFDTSIAEASTIWVWVRAMGARSIEARSIMEKAGAQRFQG